LLQTFDDLDGVQHDDDLAQQDVLLG
jgi:hypothetical protein